MGSYKKSTNIKKIVIIFILDVYFANSSRDNDDIHNKKKDSILKKKI